MSSPGKSLAIETSGTATSRDGYQFEPNTLRWKLCRDTTVSLQWSIDLLSSALAESLVKVLTHYAIRYSAAHTNNLCDRFRAFSVWSYKQKGRVDRITANDLISYRHTLDREHEWYLGALAKFLKVWVALHLDGVDSDVPSLLEGWTLRGNLKGVAVQTKSPTEGPLTDLELEALQARLMEEFERGQVDLADYVLVTLFCATGRRPAQLADLKAKDLIEAHSSDGLQEFLLNVPRRKVRHGGWRSEFKAVALTPEIGRSVRALIAENDSTLRAVCGSVDRQLSGQLPLFPRWTVIEDAASAHEHSFADLMTTEAAHSTSVSMKMSLGHAVAKLSVVSERTGHVLRVFPTRLRRTLATRAAREGYGSLVIAELLDHSDDQNARVYTENVPEHVDAINEAVARQLAPLAQAFAGTLVRSEREALRGDDPTSRVRSDSGRGTGTCGHFGFCGALAPIACYTCRHFQPWLDGPHEEVLHGLLEERDRIKKLTRDGAIASVNDRTIYAVTQVVQMCEARRKELGTDQLDG